MARKPKKRAARKTANPLVPKDMRKAMRRLSKDPALKKLFKTPTRGKK